MSIPTEPYLRVVDTIIPASLLLPGQTPTFQTVVLAPGFSFLAGQVVGIATTGAYQGYALPSLPSATDGSQNPCGIVALPLATFAGDGVTPLAYSASIYQTGKFCFQYLQYDPSWSQTAIRLALMACGCSTDATGYSG